MEDFASALLLGFLVLQFVNVVKQFRAGDYGSGVTMLVCFALGIVLAFLVAETDWAAEQTIFGVTLDDMDGWSKVVAGIVIGAVGMTAYDVLPNTEAPRLFRARSSRSQTPSE